MQTDAAARRGLARDSASRMAYSDITFKDRNAIKRWLQARRLVVAARMAEGCPDPRCILDFGAGNGELCKRVARQFPSATIICYEPTPSLMAEARDNLAALPQVRYCESLEQISDGSVDLLFCLEVLEHLPEKETGEALRQFNRLLGDDGRAVIGVPVEIGIPALYKGMFRMSRRYNAFDASVGNVLLAALSRPPQYRPVSEIAPGLSFHPEHLGFDHRRLEARLRAQFALQKIATSPFALFGPRLHPEVNFLVRKAGRSVDSECDDAGGAGRACDPPTPATSATPD